MMQAEIRRCSGCGRLFAKAPGVCCGVAPVVVDTFYQLLDCPEDCSRKELDKKFRTLAMVLHPDRNPLPECRELFVVVADAYQLLRDPERRLEYDRSLREGRLVAAIPEEFQRTSRIWSQESFTAFQEKMAGISAVFHKLSYNGRGFFSFPEWADRESAIRGRLAAAAYALNGFWFGVVGVLLFPLLMLRFLRRKPAREETFLFLLGVLQLVPLLGYLIVMEQVPLLFHLLFWAVWTSASLLMLIWKRKFRLREHPLCIVSPDVPR